MISLRDTTSVTTLAQEATPSTRQPTFPTSQAASVRSPATTQIVTTSTPCSDIRTDLPRNVSPPRTLPKPQPKRRLEGSSLSQRLRNRDLEWFKARPQPAAAPQPKPATSVVDPAAQPNTPELLNDAPVPPAATMLRPSCTRQPLPSELMTVDEPSAADIIDRSSTCAQPAVLTEEITPAEITMSDPQPENVPRDSESLPSDAPGNIAPDVAKPSLTPHTDSLVPMQPSLEDMRVENRGGELPLSLVASPHATPPRFGGDMAVMMFRQGLGSSRGTLVINFNLNDTLYLQIARWAKRKSSPTDLEQSVCVSFACYHLLSLPPNLPEDDQRSSFEKLTMHSQCSWPKSGDLSLQTTRDGKNFIIPLAPPIFFTPDNCVDVSAFIRSGENTFSVVQQSDMSEYVFMLHAHYPTAKQLSNLASCKRRRQDWVKTLRALCKPEPMNVLWRHPPSCS